MDKVLVTYASFAGSTAEVAESVALTLREQGIEVDLAPLKAVKDVRGYRALVMGSAIRMGKIHPGALSFLVKHQQRISRMPLAFFVLCLTMKENTEENRCTVGGFLEPLWQKVPAINPVNVGMFAGAIDYNKLRFPFNLFMRSAEIQGDFRDWNAIREWASGLPASLLATKRGNAKENGGKTD